MTATVTQLGARKIDYALAAQMLRDIQEAAKPDSVGMALLKEAQRLCERERLVQELLALIREEWCSDEVINAAWRVRGFTR